MAMREFGGSVLVDFSDVRLTLLDKLSRHRDALVDMLNDNDKLHDFERFNVEVSHLQATVRLLDVLSGHVDIYGNPPPQKTVITPHHVDSGSADTTLGRLHSAVADSLQDEEKATD